MIVILTIEEARKLLEENGMKVSAPHLRAGIDCGAYPFGVSIQMSKQKSYEIYKPLLEEWIRVRSA